MLALTYDDGPDTHLTVDVLEMLGARNTKATFFVMGRKVDACRGLVERAIREGHEVASHSQIHLHAWKVAPWRAYRDVSGGFQALVAQRLSPRLFRPPYGKVTAASYLAAKLNGARVVWWTIDSGDTHRELPTPESVAERVVRAGGGVVLMHDFDRGPERAEFVLKTTQCILDAANRHELRVVRLSELLADKP